MTAALAIVAAGLCRWRDRHKEYSSREQAGKQFHHPFHTFLLPLKNTFSTMAALGVFLDQENVNSQVSGLAVTRGRGAVHPMDGCKYWRFRHKPRFGRETQGRRRRQSRRAGIGIRQPAVACATGISLAARMLRQRDRAGERGRHQGGNQNQEHRPLHCCLHRLDSRISSAIPSPKARWARVLGLAVGIRAS